ncbi:unnamed protein product, partial [marine sediment metagenome]
RPEFALLLPMAEIGHKPWRKVCTYQFPEGRLGSPRYMDVPAHEGPLVSIIIPTPGRDKHLRRCVNSIYSHTTTPFEVIIIDNGSEDGTFKFLEQEQWRGNFHGVRLNANVGFQKATNFGMDRAKGKYLLLFNDDAWVESLMPDGRDWLRTLIDALEADPSLGLVGPHEGDSPALGGKVLYFWCVMMRRTLYEQVGPLDDVLFFNYGGDDDYCERVRRAGHGVKVVPGFEGRLRHFMNLVPEKQKNEELEKSRAALRGKYPELVREPVTA